MEIQIGKNEHFQKGKVNNRNKIKKYPWIEAKAIALHSLDWILGIVSFHTQLRELWCKYFFFLCVCVFGKLFATQMLLLSPPFEPLTSNVYADADFIWLPFRLSCHVPRTRSERYCGTTNKKIKMKAASLNLTTGFLHKCQRTVQVICLGSFALKIKSKTKIAITYKTYRNLSSFQIRHACPAGCIYTSRI